MFVLLFVLWVVFNGKLNWEIAAFGAVLSGLVYAFSCAFLGYNLKTELRALKMIPQIGRYIGLVMSEIVKSNLALIRVVYSPRMEVKPRLVKFRTPLKGAYKAVLSDSITLTPGTITAGLYDGQYCIHALDKAFAGGMDESDFVKAIVKLEE